jgi:hypothetical protein
MLCFWCAHPDAEHENCKRCDSIVHRGQFLVAGFCMACHPSLRRGRPTSCPHCLAWGVHRTTLCKACYSYARANLTQACTGCGRVLPCREGHCRLCWAQARLLEGEPHIDPRRYFDQLPRTGHQLFLATMRRTLQLELPRWRHQQRLAQQRALTDQPTHPDRDGVQLRLCDVPRDYSRADRARDADIAGPYLAEGRRITTRLAELRGWSPEVRMLTDRGLVVVLPRHHDGETIRYSHVQPLAADRKVDVERVCEVLAEMAILDDDRPDTFELWLERRLADLAPGIADDVAGWLRTLHRGGPRQRPRSRSLAWGHLAAIHPYLLHWSARYQHLREVTREDIAAIIAGLHGTNRYGTHAAFRSLFGYCKRNRLIFRNPTAGIVAGKKTHRLLLPLDNARYADAVAAAATAEQRAMLALTAVHAARRPALRRLTLDDIDMPNRRISIDGHIRPLDELTRKVLNEYLDCRRSRWPHTANRHLFISRITANETGPVSDYWCHTRFAGLSVTLEQLRIDRQLEEALVARGDPRHVAAVFGVSEPTAIRYATAAQALLSSGAEAHDPPDRAASQRRTRQT